MQEQDTMFVNNAGLVLLAPWLPEYFKQLDLLKNRAFIDEQAQHRAVHLLQFLASGKSETPEYLLNLNKILCGLSIQDMISDGIQIIEHEEATSTQLLDAVIQNWSSIGNTSIDGLRENFFIRDGKLEDKEDRWMRQVENRAYDILLDSLPWNISRISFPWMEKEIQIEWR